MVILEKEEAGNDSRQQGAGACMPFSLLPVFAVLPPDEALFARLFAHGAYPFRRAVLVDGLDGEIVRA